MNNIYKSLIKPLEKFVEQFFWETIIKTTVKTSGKIVVGTFVAPLETLGAIPGKPLKEIP